MVLFKKNNSPAKKLWMVLWTGLWALLMSCSADYDEFGTSPYHMFNEIVFEEQEGDAEVYPDEQRMVINLKAVSDSQRVWDSVTIESINISNMASLHLVESKVLEFPSDSLALDSLVKKVAYVEKKLKDGSKLRLPASRTLYMVIIAENGDMALWQLKFVVPDEGSSIDNPGENGSGESGNDGGETSKSSDNSISLDFKDALETVVKGDSIYVTYPQGYNVKSALLSNVVVPSNATVSPDPKSIKDWSAPQKIKVKAEDGLEKVWTVIVSSIKSNATDLQLLFKDQLKVNRTQDTIYIKLVNGASVGGAVVDTFIVSEGATVTPKPDTIKAWKNFQSFKVTAEDGTVKTWVLSLSIAAADEKVSSDKELISISATGEESAATIDKSKKTVELHLKSGSDLSSVKVSLEISETASHNLPETLDLRDAMTFTITAEDASSETWTLTASVPAEPPRVLSLKIAGKQAVIDTVEKSIHVDSLAFRTDLKSLELTELKLSNGATVAGFTVGSKYDFGTGQELVVKNASGESFAYRVKAGYQLPGGDFNSWNGDKSKPDSIWGNANTIITTTEKYTSGSLIGAVISTNSVMSKIASGSLYTADFNPNGVGTLSMANASTWPDGNELLDFGKPFAARPEYVEFRLSYVGKSGDSCDAYILLENRTGDKNVNRKSSDVNKLVASAWYRSTTDNNSGRTNPDVVSVSERDANGMVTIRLKLKYGKPLSGSPIENSSTFNTTLRSSNKSAINNGLIQGTGDEPVTHIRVVFASSADGNHYVGVKDSKLIVDDIRLIY